MGRTQSGRANKADNGRGGGRESSGGRGGGASRNRGGKKPSPRKARSNPRSRTRYEDETNRRRSGPAGNANALRGGARLGGRGEARRRRGDRSENLPPVHVSKNSIHSPWKRELGGLVRWYVDIRCRQRGVGTTAKNAKDVEREIEQMYHQSGCSVEGTKEAILLASGAVPLVRNHCRIELSMTVESGQKRETDGGNADAGGTLGNIGLIDRHGKGGGSDAGTGAAGIDMDTETTNPGLGLGDKEASKGTRLQTERRNGEGPAHQNETWNVAVVPRWAVGKSFFIEGENRSPLDMSCEMTIDGTQVARNFPVRANKRFAIWPDNPRYFAEHKWVLQAARRVHVRDAPPRSLPGRGAAGRASPKRESTRRHQQRPPLAQKTGPRYNKIRPDYKGERVDAAHFPDAEKLYGWTFTGSLEASRVEYFEKKLNFGVVKLDFYYTTATVKTTLDHPTTGLNQLFRKCKVFPKMYRLILENPRVHTGAGYRNAAAGGGSQTQKTGDESAMVMERPGDTTETAEGDSTTAADMAVDAPADAVTGDDASNDNASNDNDDAVAADGQKSVYYAKNDAYDFREGGHANRAAAMTKLLPTEDFGKWEKAAQSDWACVHAKFFIALAKKRGNARMFTPADGKSERVAEALPEMAPIVDVKAAERAVLATKFDAVGGLSAEPRARSFKRMERIGGLDDQENRVNPVFEYKLYYRADDAFFAAPTVDESELAAGLDDDEMEEEEEDGVPLAEKLRGDMDADLAGYKKEKHEQVAKWHCSVRAEDLEDEVEEALERCNVGILSAQDTKSVDDFVTVYWKWYQKQVWSTL